MSSLNLINQLFFRSTIIFVRDLNIWAFFFFYRLLTISKRRINYLSDVRLAPLPTASLSHYKITLQLSLGVRSEDVTRKGTFALRKGTWVATTTTTTTNLFAYSIVVRNALNSLPRFRNVSSQMISEDFQHTAILLCALRSSIA